MLPTFLSIRDKADQRQGVQAKKRDEETIERWLIKALCVLGSPRPNGNSSVLAAYFCNALRERGAEVRTYALNRIAFRGCQGCLTCKETLVHCALKDGLTEVLEAVRETDILIMATPVYFGDVTSQMKGFIDRLYCFLTPDYHTNPGKSRLAPGKKLVFIQVQGRPVEQHFAGVFARYEEFFEWYGIKERYLIRCWGIRELGKIQGCREVFARADEVAEQIISDPAKNEP